MSRKSRNLQAGYSYHVTTRCNNREFKLSKRECREVFLYAINKALSKYKFKLYALCIMSNHVHYLIEPTPRCDPPAFGFPPYQGGLGGIAQDTFGKSAISAMAFRLLIQTGL